MKIKRWSIDYLERRFLLFAEAGAEGAAAAAGAEGAGGAAGTAGASGAAAAGAATEGAAAGAAGAAGAAAEGAAAGAAADWRTAVTDEKLREHAARFTTLDDLVKGNLDLRSERDRLKSTGLTPPGKDAKPEDVALFRKAVGIPDAPEGYRFPEIPAEMLTDSVKAARADWAKVLHENNVPASAAEALINKLAGESRAQLTAQIAADKLYAEQTTAALKTEWGADYEVNKTFADRAFEKLFEGKLGEVRQIETKDGKFVLDHPDMLRVFAKIGREMSEGGLGGAITEGAKIAAATELSTVREQITAAQGRGDSKEANRLFQKEQDIIRRTSAGGPIVGTAGRAA